MAWKEAERKKLKGKLVRLKELFTHPHNYVQPRRRSIFSRILVKAMNLDKIFAYAPIVLILFVLLLTIFVEIFGCNWGDLLGLEFGSLFTPGIKVIG